jgi:hypothetical protein
VNLHVAAQDDDGGGDQLAEELDPVVEIEAVIERAEHRENAGCKQETTDPRLQIGIDERAATRHPKRHRNAADARDRRRRGPCARRADPRCSHLAASLPNTAARPWSTTMASMKRHHDTAWFRSVRYVSRQVGAIRPRIHQFGAIRGRLIASRRDRRNHRTSAPSVR